MKKNIVFIASYNNMIQEAYKAYDELCEEYDDLFNSYRFSCIVANGITIKDIYIDADVIIARGASANYLKKQGNIPVVEMFVEGVDLIKTFSNAKRLYGNKKLAVITGKYTALSCKSIIEILKLDAKIYKIEDVAQFPQLIEKSRSEGCEVLIAGRVGCSYCQEKGYNSVLIVSGVESIKKAIIQSMRTADISRIEQRKNKVFQSVLDNIHDGLIAVDVQNNITQINTTALKILDIEENVVGKNIADIIKDETFKGIIYGDDEHEQVIGIKGDVVSVLKKQIKLKGDITGQMYILQNVTYIQNLEQRIRSKKYEKQYYAKGSFDDVLGQCELVEEIKRKAYKISDSDANILIHGESGTGKNLFAQSIHNVSKRKGKPFVSINCATLSDDVLEKELFGYVKGAFGGERTIEKTGLFEIAHRGTIFLNRIGELSLSLQKKVVRVLEEKETIKISGEKAIPVNFRVICSTNQDLKSMVYNNQFRADLYYRINVLKLNLPPLRNRKEDIEILANHFLKYFSEKVNKGKPELSRNATALLREYEFYGNIRELRNLCERIVILNDKNIVSRDYISELIKEDNNTTESGYLFSEKGSADDNVTKDAIVEALEISRFSKTKAADKLGISRSTLYRKMKEFNI